MRKKVCDVAAADAKQQAPGRSEPERSAGLRGGAAGGHAAKKGGSTFDTLNGNVLGAMSASGR